MQLHTAKTNIVMHLYITIQGNMQSSKIPCTKLSNNSTTIINPFGNAKLAMRLYIAITARL